MWPGSVHSVLSSSGDYPVCFFRVNRSRYAAHLACNLWISMAWSHWAP